MTAQDRPSRLPVAASKTWTRSGATLIQSVFASAGTSPVAACMTKGFPATVPWNSCVAPSSSTHPTAKGRGPASPSQTISTTPGRRPTAPAVPAGTSWSRSRASSTVSASATMPGPSTVAGTRFIGGEPMKVATKRLAGRR